MKNFLLKGAYTICLYLLVSKISFGQNPLEPAYGFNVFTQNNYTLSDGDIEGAFAAGGNFTWLNSGQYIGDGAGAGPAYALVNGLKYATVVAGSANFDGSNGNFNYNLNNQNWLIKFGLLNNATYNTNSKQLAANGKVLQINGSNSMTQTTTADFQGSNIINFTEQFNALKANSLALAACNNTVTPLINGTIYEITNLNTGTNVWNINGANLDAIINLKFLGNGVPSATKTLIINVNAPGVFNFSVPTLDLQRIHGKYIIWNFYNATEVNFSANILNGSVLAPLADVSKQSPNIEGQIIAKSYIQTGGGETHIAPFEGNFVCANCVMPISILAGADGEVCANLPNLEIPEGTLGLNIPKRYQLAGQVSAGSTVTWSDMGAGGTFDDPTKLNALYTPPVGATQVTLKLTSNDPEGPCEAATDQLVLKIIACAGIIDPCVCHEVTYLPSETMEVEDFLEIDGTPGQIWRIIVNGGGPKTASQGGGSYGFMQLIDYVPPMDNTPVPLGTIVPETASGSGIYRYDFAHDSGAGYNVTVRNDQTGQELSISNYCVLNTITPNFVVGSTICNTAGAIDLLSLINDTDPTTTSGTVVDPIGTVSYFYTVNNSATPIPIVADATGKSLFNPSNLAANDQVKIIAKYTPSTNNVIDCQITREATNAFTITNCSVLSVNLVDFKAKVVLENIVLNWKTAEEKNFSNFEIQKENSSREFISLGKVTTNDKGLYNFTDRNPNFDNNYYRLKMVNTDGTFDNSKVISIKYEKNKNFLLVQNFSTNSLINVSTNLKNPHFQMYNTKGTKVDLISMANGLGQYSLQLKTRESGIFFLTVQSEGKLITKKVVIP